MAGGEEYMELPDDLKYTKDHEWVKIEGNVVTIGITDYAQEQLGDIVFVELPGEGEEVLKDDTFGAVESVKSVSDCFSPISGKVVEVNDLLQENPETINEDCYGEGWMIKVETKDLSDFEELLSKNTYEQFIMEEIA